MSSVITTDFEKWKTQQVAAGNPVVLDEFVFAYVPDLDPAQTISRDEKLPAESQIVHRQSVNKTGLASENAVAYSVTLGTEVGHFDFNWIGLMNKASGVIGMITHAPTQKKIKTANGLQGNVLTRSFLLEFDGAATETAITTTAETWQIDFTARLTGIDEMQRLINTDSYGEAAFFGDGFAVVRQGEQYLVKKGLAYVGGLRGVLEFDQTLNSLRNIRVYADFSYQGNLVSQWKTTVKITAANDQKNYVDAAGYPHYVFAIALIDGNGNVTDLRRQGTLNARDIADLQRVLNQVQQDYATKAALLRGLNAKQPKGDYATWQEVQSGLNAKQTKGDYATKEDLKTGLAGKFNHTGGEISGSIDIRGNITSYGDVIQVVNNKNNQSLQLDVTNDGIVRINARRKGEESTTHLLPGGSGQLMQLGDNGFAGKGVLYNHNQKALESVLLRESSLSQIFRNDTTTTLAHRYSPSLLMRTGDTSAILSVDFNSANVKVTSVLLNNNERKKNDLYGTGNTKVDRSGYLRIDSSSTELVGVPVGGTVLWNSSAPIPADFWPNEGREFSASDYPELARIFPDLKLPDDRGYAIRIADNGRKIDMGRTVGTYQDDAMRNLTGAFTARADSGALTTGVFSKEGAGQTMSSGPSDVLGTIHFNAARQVPTAHEFRMKNVAKILITRIK
ncbi:phage tail protein [Xenorhabdus budapestensis]|uniref:Phage tail protein n=1 Tax=Xenorhabdus budapestensis TaxID=290110 RepID=A0ABX7VKP9_XENBU|nr:phage tail protein [Xenorhabdus budapestensis]QTL40272.1 phage tail protein [Xenorhabdus budapestensis]